MMRKLIIMALFSAIFSFSHSQTVCEVRELLESYNIKNVDIVLKQSILETGWYTSKCCKENNNIFGFWYNGNYLKFDFWEQSIAYYKCWQDKRYQESCEDYYEFLEIVGYAEDPEYINKLKAINNDMGNMEKS